MEETRFQADDTQSANSFQDRFYSYNLNLTI